MTWQETIRFFTGCMPREVAEALPRQPEDGVREIRLRAGGQSGLVTASGCIACGSPLTQPQVSQIAEALCEHALYVRAEEQRQKPL